MRKLVTISSFQLVTVTVLALCQNLVTNSQDSATVQLAPLAPNVTFVTRGLLLPLRVAKNVLVAAEILKIIWMTYVSRSLSLVDIKSENGVIAECRKHLY